MSEEFTPREITGMDVVREARAYMGVRFKHAGASAEGLCCSGLALVVARATGQVPAHLRLPAHSSLRPDPRLFLRMRRWCDDVAEGEGRPGDIALMSHGASDTIQHCAFLTDVGLLHIFPAASICRVTEHSLDPEWRRRIRLLLRLKGVRRGD